MCKYRSIIENPEKLRSMTGLTADEFHALVPIFHAAFEAYMRGRSENRMCGIMIVTMPF